MPAKAIIGFLDILGYDNIVATKINDVEFIKGFDNAIHGITVNILNKFKELGLAAHTDKPVDDIYFQKVANSIKVKYIYDNIIFSLLLSDITFDSEEFDQKTTIFNCIETFFSLMSMVSTLFICKMGHVLRGGISVGSHYESEHENYLFIFSEAHNKAVLLEKEADYPRILLDDNLRSYLDKMGNPRMEKFFYKDEDGKYCFDIYSFLTNCSTKKKVPKVLEEIKNALTSNIEYQKNKKEWPQIWPKLKYFAKYHNRKVSSDELNCPDLVINIDRFEK